MIAGKHTGESMRPAHHIASTSERVNKNWPHTMESQIISLVIYFLQLHLLIAPVLPKQLLEPSQTSTSWGRVLKHMSLWGTFHVQNATTYIFNFVC